MIRTARSLWMRWKGKNKRRFLKKKLMRSSAEVSHRYDPRTRFMCEEKQVASDRIQILNNRRHPITSN